MLQSKLHAAADGEFIYCSVERLQDNDIKVLLQHQPSSSNTETAKHPSQKSFQSL
jgi:hypothetical protein